MTTWEIIGSCLASALGGSSVVATIVRVRAKRDLSIDRWLRKRVETLETRIDAKEADCTERLSVVEEKVDAAVKRGQECEGRAMALARELLDMRRAVGLHRDGDTGRFTLPPRDEE